MGFNKRSLNESYIKDMVQQGYSLDKIFKADSLIFMDSYSYNLYENFKQKNWYVPQQEVD